MKTSSSNKKSKGWSTQARCWIEWVPRTSAVRFASVLAILFAIALAALAAPQNQDRDHDRDHDRDSAIFVSRERMTQDFGGGGGGRPAPDALCGEDSVAVGFHMGGEEYIDAAWLDCAHVRHDGDIGDEIRRTEATGARGGRNVYDALCPQGFALRGLRGRTGASIDEAFGVCSPLREIAGRRDNPRTEMTQPITRPNPGGHPAEALCPMGFVVTGFRSKSGTHMDHLWLVCSELRRADRDRDHDRDH